MPANIALSSLPSTDLQRELARRRRVASTIEVKRNRLAAKIARLETLIRGLGGEARAVPLSGPGRRRARNDATLPETLARTLKCTTMRVMDMAEAVKAAGYQTGAKHFRSMIAIALTKHKRLFRKVGRGLYTAR